MGHSAKDHRGRPLIVVTGIGNALYIWMRTRAERWIK